MTRWPGQDRTYILIATVTLRQRTEAEELLVAGGVDAYVMEAVLNGTYRVLVPAGQLEKGREALRYLTPVEERKPA